MRKGVAILLTMIMLLIGIQPVLSLHLCGGTLFSVSLFDEISAVSCCDMPEPATTEDNPAIAVYQPDCCDFQSLKLATDDFSHDAEQYILRNQTPVTGPLWAVIYALLEQIPFDQPLTHRQLFPPAGLSRLTADLLTLICIYRL